MKAFVFLSDAKHRALAKSALRRLGCTDITYNAGDIGTTVFQYAIVQVFDKTAGHEKYDMDPSDPRMQWLAEFIRMHPECYVVAVTHDRCTNDGLLSHHIGADWWIMDEDMSLLRAALNHARTAHRQLKGIPSWEQEVA